jgi:hypothetical protein
MGLRRSDRRKLDKMSDKNKIEQTRIWQSALVLGIGGIATLAWVIALVWLVLHMLDLL